MENRQLIDDIVETLKMNHDDVYASHHKSDDVIAQYFIIDRYQKTTLRFTEKSGKLNFEAHNSNGTADGICPDDVKEIARVIGKLTENYVTSKGTKRIELMAKQTTMLLAQFNGGQVTPILDETINKPEDDQIRIDESNISSDAMDVDIVYFFVRYGFEVRVRVNNGKDPEKYFECNEPNCSSLEALAANIQEIIYDQLVEYDNMRIKPHDALKDKFRTMKQEYYTCERENEKMHDTSHLEDKQYNAYLSIDDYIGQYANTAELIGILESEESIAFMGAEDARALTQASEKAQRMLESIDGLKQVIMKIQLDAFEKPASINMSRLK